MSQREVWDALKRLGGRAFPDELRRETMRSSAHLNASSYANYLARLRNMGYIRFDQSTGQVFAVGEFPEPNIVRVDAR